MLEVVAEAGLQLRQQAGGAGWRGRCGDRGRCRQEGEVSVEPATGAVQVGEAEAADVTVAVVVAARVALQRRRIGAKLNHAERDARAGEVVATAESVEAGLGAGEG